MESKAIHAKRLPGAHRILGFRAILVFLCMLLGFCEATLLRDKQSNMRSRSCQPSEFFARNFILPESEPSDAEDTRSHGHSLECHWCISEGRQDLGVFSFNSHSNNDGILPGFRPTYVQSHSLHATLDPCSTGCSLSRQAIFWPQHGAHTKDVKDWGRQTIRDPPNVIASVSPLPIQPAYTLKLKYIRNSRHSINWI